MADELKRLLTRDALRRMAGARSYERGEAYARAGAVRRLEREGDAVTAQVRGTRPYTTTLGALDGELAFACTCPVAEDGGFCKHCVALGLAWLDGEEAGGGRKKRAVTQKDIRAWLERQPKEALVALLLEHAKTDDRLQRHLALSVAKESRGGVNLATFERALDDALCQDDFIDYREAYDYAQGIDEVVDSIEGLLKAGHAPEVIALAETALARVEAAMGSVDDSDGCMGSILERLQTLHLKACKAAKPEPVALAERLFAWELGTSFDTFYDAGKTYASVLGTEGLARHRELLESAWARLPALKPGSREDRYGKRHALTRMMEALAERSGDLDARVAVLRRDLADPWSFLKIAKLCREAGRHDEALDWAERGVKAFPGRTDARLREFLAEEYHRRGRHPEAMKLAWTAFSELPGLDRYQALKKHADQDRSWAQWREKALALLREQLSGRAKQSGARRWYGARDGHSPLVEIFLWERKPDTAWEEAVAGGCSRDLWLQLAAKREKDHPADALEVYRRLIDPTVEQKHQEAYKEAVSLLKKVRELLGRLDRGGEFGPYLAEVRATHRRKRNFVALLDGARWG